MKHYLYNPDLPIIKPGWKGNLLIDGKFVNNTAIKKPSFLSILKWKMGEGPKREEKKDTFRLKVIQNSSFIDSRDDVIVWLGHSFFLIRISGVTFITDPCFTDMFFIKRLASLPCAAEKLKGVDYLLISHNHRDHADKKSIKNILKNNPNSKTIVPLKTGGILNKFTKNIIEMGWYQKYQAGNTEVYFLPARHWTKRGLGDYNKSLWGSFLLKGKGKVIYFAGDTGWDSHFEEAAKLFPQIDYAILPIGAYQPQWLMKQAHISPAEVVEASKSLNAKNTIPMHYGTYKLSDEPVGEPVKKFTELCAENNVMAIIPDIGQEIKI